MIRQQLKLGFTLIEVLLALAIIAIALTALLKNNAHNITTTIHLKDKSISHWVAMQGISMIQLGLITPMLNQEKTYATHLLNEKWYWRVKLSLIEPHIQKIMVTTSKNQTGPFNDLLIGYKYQ